MVEFEHDWLMSCLAAIKPRFGDRRADDGSGPTASGPGRDRPGLFQMPVLSERVRPPASDPPNSARYRLDRWKALTGHDVETFMGLAASVAALELAPPMRA